MNTTKPYVSAMLHKAGMRLGKKRLQIANLLFNGHNKHVTADSLAKMLEKNKTRVSLATIYNTLNRFAAAGLIKYVSIGKENWFDTNTKPHHHLYFEDENRIVDLPGNSIKIHGLPKPPKGSHLQSVELTVRIKSKTVGISPKS